MGLIYLYYHFATRQTTTAPEEPQEPVPLAAPTSFAAAADGEAAVLTWTPNPAGGNQVLEKEENGARGPLAEISAGATTYRREQQGFGTSCTYYLKCKGDGVNTLDSPDVSTTLTIAAEVAGYAEAGYVEQNYSV